MREKRAEPAWHSLRDRRRAGKKARIDCLVNTRCSMSLIFKVSLETRYQREKAAPPVPSTLLKRNRLGAFRRSPWDQPLDIQREFFDFYRTSRGEVTPEGASPERTTKPTVTSNMKFMNFYPFNDIETISPRPMLFISGDQAHSREFSERAYELAGEPKELLWAEGVCHVDLYDRVDLIPFDRLAQFFETNLTKQAARLVRD